MQAALRPLARLRSPPEWIRSWALDVRHENSGIRVPERQARPSLPQSLPLWIRLANSALPPSCVLLCRVRSPGHANSNPDRTDLRRHAECRARIGRDGRNRSRWKLEIGSRERWTVLHHACDRLAVRWRARACGVIINSRQLSAVVV